MTKSTLSAPDLATNRLVTTRRYELILPIFCCNSIAVLHYDLVPYYIYIYIYNRDADFSSVSGSGETIH